QTARHLAHDTLGGERKNVGESKRRGIARAGFLANAGSVDNQNLSPRLGKQGRSGDADDTAADNQNILLTLRIRFHRIRLPTGFNFALCLAEEPAETVASANRQSPCSTPARDFCPSIFWNDAVLKVCHRLKKPQRPS